MSAASRKHSRGAAILDDRLKRRRITKYEYAGSSRCCRVATPTQASARGADDRSGLEELA